MEKSVVKFLAVSIITLLLLTSSQCASKAMPAANLPTDILGISIGMSKENAQKQLEEIAVFDRDERKRQQIWQLRDGSRFKQLAIGYDDENNVRYVAFFVDEETVKERVRFDSIGDITKATKRIVEPHYRYVWEVEANQDKPAYLVDVYGKSPEFLTMYILSKRTGSGESKEKKE